MRLYSRDAERLYLNASERERFLNAALKFPEPERTFCLTLFYTGCRISEAVNLEPHDLQFEERLLSVRSLKKRGKTSVREIPIPGLLARELKALNSSGSSTWGEMSRTTGYRWVKAVMAEARINGKKACPKGLRHGYGVHAIQTGIQLHMLQKWMGHADMNTTAIYATAFGAEEQELAKRMW